MVAQDWIDELTEDEFSDLVYDISGGFDIETKLELAYKVMKERSVIGADYFVEFTSDADGNISGATLAYNGRIDYLNLTLPLWGSDIQKCFDLDTVKEQVYAVQTLIEETVLKLAPFVEAIEGVI